MQRIAMRSLPLVEMTQIGKSLYFVISNEPTGGRRREKSHRESKEILEMIYRIYL